MSLQPEPDDIEEYNKLSDDVRALVAKYSDAVSPHGRIAAFLGGMLQIASAHHIRPTELLAGVINAVHSVLAGHAHPALSLIALMTGPNEASAAVVGFTQQLLDTANAAKGITPKERIGALLAGALHYGQLHGYSGSDVAEVMLTIIGLTDVSKLEHERTRRIMEVMHSSIKDLH